MCFNIKETPRRDYRGKGIQFEHFLTVKRRQEETAKERVSRLSTVCASRTQRRQQETAEERAFRLSTFCALKAQRRQEETDETREFRLRNDLALTAKKRLQRQRHPDSALFVL